MNRHLRQQPQRCADDMAQGEPGGAPGISTVMERVAQALMVRRQGAQLRVDRVE